MDREENSEKEKENKRIFVGIDMLELIDRVKKNFKKEYAFQPNIIDITNLIAKRVNENKLFSD